MPNWIRKILGWIKRAFKPNLKLVKGTRWISLVFILTSMMIAAGVLFAANTYYNLDTGEVITKEVQRITQLTRATGGLIAGGGATDTLNAGVKLQVSGGNLRVGAGKFTVDEATGNTYVAGTSTFAATSTFETDAVWKTGDGANIIGFDAPSTATGGDQIYTLPGEGPTEGYVLTTDASGNLSWASATSSGVGGGDIYAVGDVTSGDAFASGGSGTSLWFHDSGYTGEITIGTLTGTTTYTLPDLTGTLALTSGGLGTGAVLFSNGGLIATSSNLYWDSGNSRLGVRTTTPDYPLDVSGAVRSTQLRIATTSNTGEVVFKAPSMSSNTVYLWPTNTGTDQQVLTTDGTGGLSWQSLAGVGGVSGTGQANLLTKWTGTSTISTSSIEDLYSGGTVLTIDSTGTSTFSGGAVVNGTLDPNKMAGYTLIGAITGSGNPSITGIGGISAATATLATGLKTPKLTSTGTTTVGSANGKGIVIDPDSGKIVLGSNDYIETAGGYGIGKTGNQVLREMVPILGFDLPVRCSSACYPNATTISRTIEDYPFSPARSGATRIHKFVIRYADTGTTSSSTWTVWNETNATTTATFEVPASASTDLGKGEAYITSPVAIPTDTDDWSLRMKVATSTVTIQVYDIYLAAYDQID